MVGHSLLRIVIDVWAQGYRSSLEKGIGCARVRGQETQSSRGGFSRKEVLEKGIEVYQKGEVRLIILNKVPRMKGY